MLKALYYPHTEIQSKVVLQNALLLWDKVEVIVPRPKWQFKRSSNQAFNRAVDLVVEERVPTPDEKQIAHRALSEAAQSGFLGFLVMGSPQRWGQREFLIYPDKFLYNTWNMLLRGGMALWIQHESDFEVPATVGFWMMSILADACAGTQIHKRGGSDYSAFRRRYLQAVNSYVERIGKEAKTMSDVREIERQYQEEIKNDLADLKRELKINSLKVLFSKEVALSALILAGALVAPVAGLTALATQVGGIGVIPLLKAEVDVREGRQKALREHSISWLYLCKQGPITLVLTDQIAR